MLMISLFTIGLFLIIVLLFRDARKPKGFPPGPRWVPLVGNYLLFQKLSSLLGYHHLVLERLAQVYGDVVGLKLGFTKMVVVSGRNAIREVLTREEFDGRSDGFFFQFRTFGQRLGIVFVDGPFWQEQRRFSLKHLRNFGFGRRDMEEQIMHEINDLMAHFRGKVGVPILMHNVFDVSAINVLWAMLAGERFALNDTRLGELFDIVHEAFRMLDMSGGLLNQMPFLRFIAPEQTGFNRHREILERLYSFLEKTIDEHEKTISDGNPRDLIDAFLQNMDDGKNGNTTFTRKQLISLCMDLFMAGSETTSNTLGFAILYMIKYPEVQRQIQKELDNVVSKNRWPCLQDRQRMNYVEAVIMEVQRLLEVAPVGVAHRAMSDTHLMEYSIPKNTIILVYLRSLHMDQSYWGDPKNFRPERFLDDHGNLKRSQDDWFAPFGFGRRRCLGETLAKSSLFLFFSSILHNFTIEASPEHPLPVPESFDGLTISPRPFYAILTPRNV